MFNPPPLLTASFVFLVLAVFGLLLGAIARSCSLRATSVSTLVISAALAISYLLAARGKLDDFSKLPPPLVRLWIAEIVLAVVFATSAWGSQVASKVPIWLLAGFQGFRILVELILHQLYEHDLIPIQMTWSGQNYDIASGILGLAFAIYAFKNSPPRWLSIAFNVIGLALLANIAAIALLSAPGPLRHFHNEPANTLPTHAPWVWITLLVTIALLGHLLFLRKLKKVPQ